MGKARTHGPGWGKRYAECKALIDHFLRTMRRHMPRGTKRMFNSDSPPLLGEYYFESSVYRIDATALYITLCKRTDATADPRLFRIDARPQTNRIRMLLTMPLSQIQKHMTQEELTRLKPHVSTVPGSYLTEIENLDMEHTALCAEFCARMFVAGKFG